MEQDGTRKRGTKASKKKDKGKQGLKRNWICPSCRHQTHARKRCPECDTLMVPIKYDAKASSGSFEHKKLRAIAW